MNIKYGLDPTSEESEGRPECEVNKTRIDVESRHVSLFRGFSFVFFGYTRAEVPENQKNLHWYKPSRIISQEENNLYEFVGYLCFHRCYAHRER